MNRLTAEQARQISSSNYKKEIDVLTEAIAQNAIWGYNYLEVYSKEEFDENPSVYKSSSEYVEHVNVFMNYTIIRYFESLGYVVTNPSVGLSVEDLNIYEITW